MKLVKDTDNKNLETKRFQIKKLKMLLELFYLGWVKIQIEEGLLETPKRVVKAFKEYFKGYKEDAE